MNVPDVTYGQLWKIIELMARGRLSFLFGPSGYSWQFGGVASGAFPELAVAVEDFLIYHKRQQGPIGNRTIAFRGYPKGKGIDHE